MATRGCSWNSIRNKAVSEVGSFRTERSDRSTTHLFAKVYRTFPAAVCSLMHNFRSDWNGRLQPCLDGRQFCASDKTEATATRLGDYMTAGHPAFVSVRQSTGVSRVSPPEKDPFDRQNSSHPLGNIERLVSETSEPSRRISSLASAILDPPFGNRWPLILPKRRALVQPGQPPAAVQPGPNRWRATRPHSPGHGSRREDGRDSDALICEDPTPRPRRPRRRILTGLGLGAAFGCGVGMATHDSEPAGLWACLVIGGLGAGIGAAILGHVARHARLVAATSGRAGPPAGEEYSSTSPTARRTVRIEHRHRC